MTKTKSNTLQNCANGNSSTCRHFSCPSSSQGGPTSYDPPVTGHQRRGHGEWVKCHKNVAQHLYQLATPAYKLLLAKFWMAWTCKNLASSEFAAAQTNLHKRRSCESLFERISDLAGQKVGQKCSPAKLCVICEGFGALQVRQPERE